VAGAVFAGDYCEDNEYTTRYSTDEAGFAEPTMIGFMLGLRDCHRQNYCLRGGSEASDGTFPLKFIDFMAPEGGRNPEFPDGHFGVFSDSPLAMVTAPTCRACQAAFVAAKAKLGSLSPPNFRLCVYPKPSWGPDLASILDPSRRETEMCSVREPESYSEFLRDVENQLRNNLLNPEKCPPTDERATLAELFGLTDTGEVWQDPEFETAIESAAKDERITTFEPFFDSVFRSMEHKAPPPILPGVANKSMNYGLTMLRWFGIWIGRRIEMMEQFFKLGVQWGMRF
jgi:hypothetical protein